MQNNIIYQQETLVAIGNTIKNNRQDVIRLLSKNGAIIPSDISNESLLACVLTSMVNSSVFANEFKQLVYLSSNNSLNYVDEMNTDYPEDFFNGDGEKYVGFLKDYFTPEVKKSLLDTGFKILTDKLEGTLNKKEREQMIKATIAETERLQAATALKEKERLDKEKKAENQRKVIIPIVIVSSVLVLGVVGLLIYKNMQKNKV